MLSGCARPLPERALTPTRAGWTRSGPLLHFDASNLYEMIDGEAPFVISFGFRSLTQATYRLRSGAETTADLYDMGNEANAFALFRSRFNVQAQPTDVGSEGASDEARVEFWQGPYYVAVRVPSAEESQAALALARGLASDLPPTRAWPAYLGWLPPALRVARSEQFAPSDFLGQEFLKNAVSAKYQIAGREVTLFACRLASTDEATSALARLRAELERKRPTRPLALGEGGFLGEEPVLGPLAAFRRGQFVGGMLRYVEDPAAATLLAELDRCLKTH